MSVVSFIRGLLSKGRSSSRRADPDDWTLKLADASTDASRGGSESRSVFGTLRHVVRLSWNYAVGFTERTGSVVTLGLVAGLPASIVGLAVLMFVAEYFGLL